MENYLIKWVFSLRDKPIVLEVNGEEELPVLQAPQPRTITASLPGSLNTFTVTAQWLDTVRSVFDEQQNPMTDNLAQLQEFKRGE